MWQLLTRRDQQNGDAADRSDSASKTNSDPGEDQKYQVVMDRLFKIFSDTTQSTDQKLSNILNAGLDYFELDTAVVSSVIGNSYTIHSLESNASTSLQIGLELKLDDMHCADCIESGSNVAVNGVSQSLGGKSVDRKNSDVESYIGSAVETANGPFGTVCFLSTAARPKDFTVTDVNVSLVIAGWVGYLLGSVEQAEFMTALNDHYKSLFASVPAMMFLCDSDGLVISASDHFSEEIGAEADRVPGNICLGYFHSDDKKDVQQALISGHVSHLPARLLRGSKDPLEVELDLSVKTIGTMQGIRMVVATDVSERNAAFREATEQNRLLEVANESLNRFAFVASHDLQEPLRKIQLFGSFLEEDLQDNLDEEGKYHLSVIVDSSTRMSTLIVDLLEYSRTSRLDPVLETVELESLVSGIVEELELPVKESKASIKIESLPTIQGNVPLLRQLFTNLIGNSIKYRSADRAPEVRVFSTNENGRQQIIVTDNGIGFDDADGKKIFEPFNRLHSASEYKGSGIGLAICSTVCDKHGWILSAEGQPGVGANFVIDLDRE